MSVQNPPGEWRLALHVPAHWVLAPTHVSDNAIDRPPGRRRRSDWPNPSTKTSGPTEFKKSWRAASRYALPDHHLHKPLRVR